MNAFNGVIMTSLNCLEFNALSQSPDSDLCPDTGLTFTQPQFSCLEKVVVLLVQLDSVSGKKNPIKNGVILQ